MLLPKGLRCVWGGGLQYADCRRLDSCAPTLGLGFCSHYSEGQYVGPHPTPYHSQRDIHSLPFKGQGACASFATLEHILKWGHSIWYGFDWFRADVAQN